MSEDTLAFALETVRFFLADRSESTRDTAAAVFCDVLATLLAYQSAMTPKVFGKPAVVLTASALVKEHVPDPMEPRAKPRMVPLMVKLYGFSYSPHHFGVFWL